MPGAGLEPARPEGHPILSRARLTSSATPAAVRVTPTAAADTLRAGVTHDTIVALSVLGVVGQVLIVFGLVVGAARARRRPRAARRAPRNLLWGYELWGAFVVAADRDRRQPLLLAGRALHPPCEFCWFQRVLMYPLSILTLLIAVRGDNRARALPAPAADRRRRHVDLPHPDRAPRDQGAGCVLDSAPGGCGINWIQPRVRLPHDPDARAHGLPSSHRILGPRLGRRVRGCRLPFPPHAER